MNSLVIEEYNFFTSIIKYEILHIDYIIIMVILVLKLVLGDLYYSSWPVNVHGYCHKFMAEKAFPVFYKQAINGTFQVLLMGD